MDVMSDASQKSEIHRFILIGSIEKIYAIVVIWT